MSTARKVFSNTAWQFAAKFIQAILGFVVIKITTLYLSQTGSLSAYGQYLAIYEYLAYFGIVADLGLYTIAVKEMSKDEENIPKIIGNILSLRFFLITITMILAAIIVFFIPKYNYPGSHIPIGVAIASLTVFFTILNGTITSVLQTKYQMDKASLGVIVGKIVSVAFMAYVVFFGYPTEYVKGFYMLIVAGVIGAVVNFFMTNHYVKKITPLKLRFDFDLWKKIIKESLPFGIALILSTIYFRVNSMVIFFTRGEEELAIYGPAMKMLEQFTILPLYFMNSILPILTQAVSTKNKERYHAIINNSFDVLAALALPIVVGGFILAYPLVFVIATPDFLSDLSRGFYGTDIALQILIFTLLFQFINVLFSFILIAVDQQKKLLYVNLICVIFNLTANLILVPEYGFRAAAAVSVVSEFLIFAGNYIYAKKYLDFQLSYTNFFKIIFSTILMGVAVYYLQPLTYTYLQNWNVLLLIAVGASVYGGMIFATGTMSKAKMKMIMKKN